MTVTHSRLNAVGEWEALAPADDVGRGEPGQPPSASFHPAIMTMAEDQWRLVEVALGVKWILHGDKTARKERDEWRTDKPVILDNFCRMLTQSAIGQAAIAKAKGE